MRKDSVALLILGFAIGFSGLYFWTKQREPQIVSATPLPLDPSTLSGGAASQAPAPPPVDPAVVAQIQDRLTKDPKDYEALVELGNIHFDQKNYPEAAGLYKRALEVKPDDLDVRTDYGTMLFYQNKYDEAIVELNKVLAVKPNHAQALFNLGVVFLHGKNDSQAALKTWEKLVETNPDFPQLAVVQQQIQSLKDSLKK